DCRHANWPFSVSAVHFLKTAFINRCGKQNFHNSRNKSALLFQKSACHKCFFTSYNEVISQQSLTAAGMTKSPFTTFRCFKVFHLIKCCLHHRHNSHLRHSFTYL